MTGDVELNPKLKLGFENKKKKRREKKKGYKNINNISKNISKLVLNFINIICNY
jgi:hypothetical protein